MKSLIHQTRSWWPNLKSDPIFWGILLLICIFGLLFRFYFFEDFTFDRFMDRNLFRALHPDAFFWSGGADLQGGAKTPGGFLNIYLKSLYNVSGGKIDVLFILNAVLQLIGFFYLAYQVGRHFSRHAGWIFLSLLLANYVALEMYLALWSPTLAIPFSYLAYGFLLKLCVSKNEKYLPLSVLLIVMASQIHLSNLMLFPLVLVALVATETRVRKSYVVLSIMIPLVLYAPYFIELFNSPAGFIIQAQFNPLQKALNHVRFFFESFGNLAGAVFLYPENLGVQWNYRSLLSSLGPARHLIPLFSFMPILVSVAWFRKTSSTAHQSQNAVRLLLSTLAVALLFFVLIPFVSFSNQELNIRLYLWAQPLILMYVAVSLAELWLYLKKSSRKVLSPIFLILLAVCCGSQMFFFSKNIDEQANFDLYSMKQEVVEVARQVYDLTDAQIKKNVGLISRDVYSKDPNSHYINTVREDDGSGLISLLESLPPRKSGSQDGSNQCVMVIQNEDDFESKKSRFSFENLPEFMKNVQDAPAFEVKKIHYGEKAVFFSYEKINGNCINFFENYFYIDEKLALEEALAGKKMGDVVTRMNPDTGAQEFMFFDDSYSARHYFKLDLQIGENFEGKIYQDTLEHRGEEEQTYFQLFNLHLDSTLILKNIKTGREMTIPLVGKSQMHPNLVPKGFNFSKPLPAPGEYKVSLMFRPVHRDSKVIVVAERIEIKAPKKEIKRKVIE